MTRVNVFSLLTLTDAVASAALADFQTPDDEAAGCGMFVRESKWRGFKVGLEMGWGNGYVAIPMEHPWYALDYDTLPVDVYGGLTYGSVTSIDARTYYVIGFGTAHHGDSLENWPKEAVLQETVKLYRAVVAAAKIT